LCFKEFARKTPVDLDYRTADEINKQLQGDYAYYGDLVKKLNLKTARAYHIRLNFQEFWNQPLQEAEIFLKRWYFWATHSRLEPIKEAAYTMKRHWDGILRWFTSKINNGILEGINSLIQAAKAKARGYRTIKNLFTMIYLIGGKLEFRLPT
jgi:transposase